MQLRRAAVAGLASLLAVGTLAACNSESPTNRRTHSGTGTATPGPGGVQTVVIRSGVDLRFHPSTIVVHPGSVRLVLDNTAKPGAGPPHDLQFSGLPVYIGTTQAGRESSVTFTAPAPGTYNFVCTIHARQGQTGKLIVR
ncbi:MAG TPA: cupredoxin domain-containing protein [Jatrophihabitans sp.]|jgi:plastocyanin|nr:cupredoxin domain-containing protein [Jatrophihabitans sp.]